MSTVMRRHSGGGGGVGTAVWTNINTLHMGSSTSSPREDVCRNCQHIKPNHVEMLDRLFAHEVRCTRCKCFEYIPTDNLLYLEQKYDRKNMRLSTRIYKAVKRLLNN